MGESRHNAKIELKEKMGEDYRFGMSVDTIHSYKTFDIYTEHCNRFVEWCINEKGVNKYSSLNNIKQYAKEYLQAREEKGLSLYTLKSEKSALGKLYGETIDYKFQKPRTTKEITRSRNEVKNDKHFSVEKNQDLVDICRATGGRREDIEKLTKDCFFTDKNGQMWVRFEQSKGGRDRIAPVLPEYQARVQMILETREPNTPLFSNIHGAADIHSFRREYAQELYKAVCNNDTLKEKILSEYPARNEPNIKGDTYHSHDKENQFKGDRDNIYIVSEALGHNRLEVSVNHYLK
ncbi:MAG: hypothetical protein J1F23_06840 [Oscillospiraceae bacterium]|nr:hypothetical protein [Oscillospiraceae bacterium]